MQAGQKLIRALYDTGAGPNVVHASVFRELYKQGAVIRRLYGAPPLRSAGNDAVPQQGAFLLRLQVGGRPYTGPFSVVPDLTSPMILGMRAAKDLSLDFSATDNNFVFRRDEDSRPIEINAVKKIAVAPREGKTLYCIATQDGKPVANKDIVATVLATQVLATTDAVGKFSLMLSNPSNDVIEYARREHLGAAETLDNYAPVAAMEQSNVSSIMAAVQEESKPKPTDNPLAVLIDNATKHLTQDIKGAIQQVLWKYSKAISKDKFDLGLTDILEHKIHLRDTDPVYHKQFPFSLAHLEEVRANIDKWLKLGIVEPARSRYNSPIFCVKKKGGGFRMCLDYRGVNEKSFPENYTIRTPEDCMAEIGQAGSRQFIALDLSSGFYQMPLAKESRKVTAFTVPPYGQLQWTRGAMGLKGCPGSFARLMDICLSGLPNVLVYIDDVLIHGRTQQDCINTLDKVLARLAQHNLKINVGKSSFLMPSTEYLGHSLSVNGISPGKDKTAAILQAQPPTSRKALKSFLGMVNFFRNFIRHFAHKAGRLYALIRNDSAWHGGTLPPEELKLFNAIKGAIVKAVPRAFPFRKGTYHLYTDGSLGDAKEEGGLGAHLMQEDEKGDLHSIGFASRALKAHEKNYSAFLLELQAAVYAIDYFDHYLKGRSFVLYTDHAPLTKLSTVHTKTLHRLHALLNEYSFQIKHIAGKKNPVADFLSRSHGPASTERESFIMAIAAMSQAQPNGELIKQQEACYILGPIRKAMLEGRTPALPPILAKSGATLRMHKGILCARLPPRRGFLQDWKWRAVVPRSMAQAIIREAHDSALGGHQGIFRTHERIREDFWWPNMLGDIITHTRNCQTCQATSMKDAPPASPNQEYEQSRVPNERIHADLFGPLKGADGSNKYILGITDSFTKILRLATIPNKEAATVAMALWKDWMAIYGIPKIIVTDQGREFTNSLSKAIFSLLKVDHKLTSPYWPVCNQAQEHQNKTLAQFLRSILHAAQKSRVDWELYLPALMLSLNTAVNKATRQAPFRTMFGYSPRLPLWEDMTVLNDDDYPMPASDKAAFLHWADCRSAARQAAHAAERQYRDSIYEAQPPPTAYKIKQPVWIRIQPLPGPNRKLAAKWEPAVVLERTSATSYKVRRLLATSHKITQANAAHIKPRQPDVVMPQDDPDLPTDDEDGTDTGANKDQADGISAVRISRNGYEYNMDEFLGCYPDTPMHEKVELIRRAITDATPAETLVHITWAPRAHAGPPQQQQHQQQQPQRRQQPPPPPPPPPQQRVYDEARRRPPPRRPPTEPDATTPAPLLPPPPPPPQDRPWYQHKDADMTAMPERALTPPPSPMQWSPNINVEEIRRNLRQYILQQQLQARQAQDLIPSSEPQQQEELRQPQAAEEMVPQQHMPEQDRWDRLPQTTDTPPASTGARPKEPPQQHRHAKTGPSSKTADKRREAARQDRERAGVQEAQPQQQEELPELQAQEEMVPQQQTLEQDRWDRLPRTPGTPPASAGARSKEPPQQHRQAKTRPPPKTADERREAARRDRERAKQGFHPDVDGGSETSTEPGSPIAHDANQTGDRRRPHGSSSSDSSTYPPDEANMAKSHRGKRQHTVRPHIITPYEGDSAETSNGHHMLHPPRLALPQPNATPPSSNMQFDQRREQARRYARFRDVAEGNFLQAVHKSTPRACKMHDNGDQWRSLHSELFNIMNPPPLTFFTPAEIGMGRGPYNRGLSPTQIDARETILGRMNLPELSNQADLDQFAGTHWWKQRNNNN